MTLNPKTGRPSTYISLPAPIRLRILRQVLSAQGPRHPEALGTLVPTGAEEWEPASGFWGRHQARIPSGPSP